MNKHVVNALAKYGFTYNDKFGYGFINDYEVNVYYPKVSNGPYLFFSTFLTQIKKNSFLYEMNARKIPLVNTQIFPFGVVVMIGCATGKSFEKKCPQVLAAVLENLESLEAPKKDFCPQSGALMDEENSKIVFWPNSKIKFRLSNDSIAAYNSDFEKRSEDYKNQPGNYLKGFGGIMIGAIAGASLTVIFSMLGFATVFAPLVSIFLGTFLYRKFGGKSNFVMIIMSFVTTLAVVLGTFVLMYISVSTKIVAQAELEYRGFEALSYCVKYDPDFRRLFYADIALNAFMILYSEGCSIFRLIRMIRRPKKLQ